jgi:hypothetical protein
VLVPTTAQVLFYVLDVTKGISTKYKFHKKGIEIQCSLDTNEMNILKVLHCFNTFIRETTSLTDSSPPLPHLKVCHKVSYKVTCDNNGSYSVDWVPKRYNIQNTF